MRIISACVLVMLAVAVLGLAEEGAMQVYLGGTYWDATSQSEVYWDTYRGETESYGVLASINVSGDWWAEFSFVTGNTDYVEATDTKYAREIQGQFGLHFPGFSLGAGLHWDSRLYPCASVYRNSVGILASAKTSYSIAKDRIWVEGAIVARPVSFSELIWGREFIDLYAGIRIHGGSMIATGGYRCRSFYNYTSNLRIHGLVFNLQIGSSIGAE